MSRHESPQLAAATGGHHPVCAGRYGQAGVGLIEVLIAVLILSIGFLGIAALQAMSLSTNNSALARSMATISSYSILDAMRADSANVMSYNNTVVKADNCPTTTGTFAQTQIGLWCKQLGQDLGASGSTSGTITCTTAGDCKIDITFDDSRSGKGGDKLQIVSTKALL